MPQHEWFVLMGMGGLFILLGIGSIIWGRSEEKSYYDSISSRPDVREFLERFPLHPEPGALKIGGRIAIAVGLPMVIVSVILWIIH